MSQSQKQNRCLLREAHVKAKQDREADMRTRVIFDIHGKFRALHGDFHQEVRMESRFWQGGVNET